MSYGRISSPKFYIDATLLAATSGMVNLDALGTTPATEDYGDRLFHLNPWGETSRLLYAGAPFDLNSFAIAFGSDLVESGKIMTSLSWFSVLGIQCDGNIDDVSVEIEAYSQDAQGGAYTSAGALDMIGLTNLYGGSQAFSTSLALNSGYCLGTFDNPWINSDSIHINKLNFSFSAINTTTLKIGSLSAGWHWSPSVSTDLNLVEEYEMGGVKKTRTIGGKDFSKIDGVGKPQWVGDGLMPFLRSARMSGLGDNDSSSYLSFRKTWKMGFSYLSDTKLKPNNDFDHSTWTGGAPFEFLPSSTTDSAGHYTGIKDDFISRVWYGTMGGVLPFIFQPTSDVEEFHIVKFVQNTISFSQVAHNTYSVSFELEEVW